MADNPLQIARDALARALEIQKSNDRFMASIGPAIVKALDPVLNEISSAVRQLRVTVEPNITVNPEVRIPPINVPEATVNVKIPEIRVPEPKVTVNVPDIIFPKDAELGGWFKFIGFDKSLYTNPLPVQIRDSKGNPIVFAPGGGVVVGGGSSGPGFPMSVYDPSTNALRIVQTSSSTSSTAVTILNGDGSSLDPRDRNWTITEVVPVSQVSGSSWSVAVVSVTDIFSTTSASSVVNPDNRVKVELPSGSSGLTDTELRASAVPVAQVSGASWSVNVTGSTGSLAVNLSDSSGVGYSGSNPLPVTFTGSSSTLVSLVNADGTYYDSANPLPTTATLSLATNQGDAASAARVVIAGNSDASVVVNSGTITTVSTLTSITNTVPIVQVSGNADSVNVIGPIAQGDAATAVRVVIAGNSDASVTATQTGTWNIGTVTTVTGITNTVATANVDSTGVQYSGSNPFPMTIVSSSLATTVVIGDIVADAADTGSAPVKVGGIARTTQPTATADGDRISFTADKLGRQLTRPIQIRDLIFSSYTSLSTGSETTIVAASAGSYHDLIYLMAANSSSAAQSIDIRAVTAGNVVATLYIPAQSTVGFSLPVGLPSGDTGNNWTADNADVTNSTIYITALYTREK